MTLKCCVLDFNAVRFYSFSYRILFDKLMTFFTFSKGRKTCSLVVGLGSLFFTAAFLPAQTETNSSLPGPGELSLAETNSPASKVPATSPTLPESTPQPAPSAPAPLQPATVSAVANSAPDSLLYVLGAVITFASLAGFLLFQTGLTRAKNSGHTSMLLLAGVALGLTGYWIGGFAVQNGGVGDAHAALAQSFTPAEKSALDHELGPIAFGHHWGLMGSSGFFLAVDPSASSGIAMLFLVQASLLAVAVAAALGGAFERGQLLPIAFCAYLVGVLVYPFLANWVWGGGWLAELGHEFGLGHGFVDVGGSGVIHETAGTLALVLATVLGPRHGRFGRNKVSPPIPGHNVPFIVLGSIVLLVSWMGTNAFACAREASDSGLPLSGTFAGLAAISTLLAATGGLVASFVQAAWEKKRPDPARLCRGLLGGAVASCGGAGLIDSWAAFIIGAVAALLVEAAVVALDRKRIDDPIGATAIHGAAGAWGVVAVGLFANGTAGSGLNGVASPVRGLLFGGAWHQLAAQIIGCVTGFAVVFLLGYACVILVQKILGLRADLADEISGLDLPELGTLGYQGDAEPEEKNGKS